MVGGSDRLPLVQIPEAALEKETLDNGGNGGMVAGIMTKQLGAVSKALNQPA